MPESSDRPDWLPAPPASSLHKQSAWQRAQSFLPKLPSLILIAISWGLVLLAGASLAFPQTAADRRSAISTAVSLVFAAAVAFGLAMLIRMAMRRRQHGLESWANDDVFSIPSFPPTKSANRPMTTQQFFGVLLRVLAIWQLINVIVELPTAIGMLLQFWNQTNQPGVFRPAVLIYCLGPALRAIIGIVLLFKADALAGLIYPDHPDDDGHGKKAKQLPQP